MAEGNRAYPVKPKQWTKIKATHRIKLCRLVSLISTKMYCLDYRSQPTFASRLSSILTKII